MWAENIAIIDPISPRYTAVGVDNIATLRFVNYKGHNIEVVSTAVHPKNPALGDRPLYKGETIYLES